jgi:hypothetical protein
LCCPFLISEAVLKQPIYDPLQLAMIEHLSFDVYAMILLRAGFNRVGGGY